MTPGTPRRPNSGPAPRRHTVWSVGAVGAARAGWRPGPPRFRHAAGARRRRASNPFVDNIIEGRCGHRRRCRGRGLDVGNDGNPEGGDAHRHRVDRQRGCDAPPPRRARAMAARVARPSHRGPAGAGAQRGCGSRAARRVVTVRRVRTTRGGFGDGAWPALRVAGGCATGQGIGRPLRMRCTRRTGCDLDRRRADTRAYCRKSCGGGDFGGANIRYERDRGWLCVRRRSAGRSAYSSRSRWPHRSRRRHPRQGVSKSAGTGSVRGTRLVRHR